MHHHPSSQHYSRSPTEFRDYYTAHLKPQFERFLTGGAYAALVEARREARQSGNSNRLNANPPGEAGAEAAGGWMAGGGAMSRADGPANGGGGGTGGSSGGSGDGGSGDGDGGEGAGVLGAQEAAARAEAELLVYKQIVGSILADEHELAALQRVQARHRVCSLGLG
jgi:hypothetical protein